MVIWITGRAGAGKTTLANKLANSFNRDVLVLDGDDVRKHFPTGYEDSDRLEHILRMAKIAAIAEMQGLVAIVACVSPRKEWRERARVMFRESFLIYLPGGKLWAGTEYEEPDDEELRPKLILAPQYQGEF